MNEEKEELNTVTKGNLFHNVVILSCCDLGTRFALMSCAYGNYLQHRRAENQVAEKSQYNRHRREEDAEREEIKTPNGCRVSGDRDGVRRENEETQS